MVRIVDCSVAVKWFFTEERGAASALAILESISQKPNEFAVPELFFYEVQNVVKKISYRNKKVSDIVHFIHDLPLMRFFMTRDLGALTLKYQNMGLSGYDAAYVALAENLRGKWVTFDYEAAQRLRSTRYCELLS